MTINKRHFWQPALILLAMAGLMVSSAVAQQASTSPGTVTQPLALVASDREIHSSPATSGVKPDYLIGNSDVLTINVWKEPEVSRTVPVRSDGRISLPLIGQLQASGKTPAELENDISKGLHDYIAHPEVTVIVQEQKSQRFNILGQVQRPGSYLLNNPVTVVDAIAIAGGFRDFAKLKGIKVLRQQPDGKQASFAFNYKQAVNGTNPAQNIQLEPGDTIYVP